MFDLGRAAPVQWPVAVGRQNVLAIWTRGNTRDGVGYAVSTDAGRTWGNIGTVPSANTDFRANLALTPDGQAAYAVWSDCSSGNTLDVKIARFDFAGNSWSNPRPVTNHNRQTNSPGIAVKPDGSIHVFYTLREGGDVGPPTGRLYYRVSHDGSNSWQDGPGWSPQGNNETLTQGSQATVDTSGRLHIAWVQKGAATWTAVENGSGGWNTTRHEQDAEFWAMVAADNAGGVGLVWQRRGSGGEIIYRRWDGSNWGGMVNISNSPNNNSQMPILAYAGAEPVIVWSEQQGAGEAMRCEIYRSDNLQPGRAVSEAGNRVLWPWVVQTAAGAVVLYQRARVQTDLFRIYSVEPSGRVVEPPPTRNPCRDGYSDVPVGYFFYDNIVDLTCRGVMTGFADGTFRPSAFTTRAEFAAYAVRGFNLPAFTPQQPTFADVPASHPNYAEIEAAAHAGVVQGGGGSYRPADNIKRGEMAVIIRRSKNWPIIRPATLSFHDLPPEHFAYPAVEGLKLRGIVTGQPDNNGHVIYRPNDPIRNDELCRILRRTLDYVGE